MLRKVLVVEDNDVNRRILTKILTGEYTVLQAENGEQALQVLAGACDEISAVLLDLFMPVMDGYEVLRRMRADSRLKQIPVIVATGSTDEGAEVQALSLGANDFVMKPYRASVIRHRLWNTIHLRETAALVNTATKDLLTGLYNREAFFQKAAELLQSHDSGHYVLACMNIDNFKVINDQYGSARGDEVLRLIANALQDGFSPEGGICCRATADHFAVLYPREMMDDGRARAVNARACALDGVTPPVTMRTGRYLVNDLTLSISAMYDRAGIAQASIKGRFDAQVALYEESMRDAILRDQEIIGEMNTALATGQFEAWYQPQYNHSTGALIGAEALVRWRHPKRGLVSPGLFIPVFERNGFIYELDKYVWEQVCLHLKTQLEKGREALPISVNISRYDTLHGDLPRVILGLIQKYQIPASLLRLEITESAFAKSTGQIIRVVKQLIECGFTMEIDDFGSGYSSLNTLKDVPAQVLKLDMRFLEGNDNSQRGGNIVESIVRMAKWLDMAVIAEGVETAAQANFLKSVGCSYVQGYLYARPMPLAEYETLLENSVKEKRLVALETRVNLDNNTFWDPSSMDTLIFNSFVGGACIFEYNEGEIELLRANDKYARALGREHMTPEDALKMRLTDYMDPAGRADMRQTVEESLRTGEEAACELILRGVPGCPQTTYLRAALRVIASAGSRYLIYQTINNITLQREAEEKQREAEKKRMESARLIEAIMGGINGGVTATVIDKRPRIRFANPQYYKQLGYTQAQFEAEVTDVFLLIHPDDRARVVRETREASADSRPFSTTYRAVRRDGREIWLTSNISIISLPDESAPVQLAVANDITLQRETEEREHRASERAQIIMDHAPCGIASAVLEGGVYRLLMANNWYYETLGYTAAQYAREVRDLFLLIHPDDRERVRRATAHAHESGAPAQMEYRVMRRDGGVRHMRAAVTMVRFTGAAAPALLCMLTDATNERRMIDEVLETDRQLRFINNAAHELLARADARAGVTRVLQMLMEYFGGRRACLLECEGGEDAVRLTYEAFREGESAPSQNAASVFPRKQLARGETLFADVGEGGLCAQLLKDRGARTMAIVPLLREDAVIGLMGIDDPARNRAHLRNLSAVGDFVTAILTRRDLDARIQKDNAALDALTREQALLISQGALPEGDEKGMAAMRLVNRLIDDSSASIYVCDRETYALLYINRKAADMCQKTVREASGQTCYQYLKNRDTPCEDCYMRHCNREMYTERVYTSPATQRHYLTRGKLIPWGGREALVEYLTDETERINAQRGLAQLVEGIPCGIGIYRLYASGALELVYLNEGYYAALGVEKEKRKRYEGMNALKVVHPDDLPRLRGALEKARETGELNCDYRALLDKGAYKWLNVRARVASRDDEKCVLYAAYADIQLEKQVIRQLEASRRILNFANREGGIDLWLYDLDKDTVSRELQMDAAAPDRAHPRALAESGAIFEKDAGAFLSMFEKLQTGAEQAECVVRARGEKGYEWHRAVYTRLRDPYYPGRFAVGMHMSVDAQQKTRLQFEHEQKLRAEIMKSAILYYEINLTDGVVTDYRAMSEGAPAICAPMPVSQALRDRILANVAPEFRRAVEDTLFSAALLRAYARGETARELDYRRALPGLGMRWVRTRAAIVQRPDDDAVIAFVYAADITDETLMRRCMDSILARDIESACLIRTETGAARRIAGAFAGGAAEDASAFAYDPAARALISARVHPGDRAACEAYFPLEALARALAGAPLCQQAYRVILEGGGEARKLSQAFYLDGEGEFIVLCQRDITGLYAEEQKQKQALEAAARAANEANRAKSEFLSRMSHDMRTPLNAVIGMVSLARDEANPPVTAEYLENIDVSSHLLLGLINDILDLSKIESNQFELKNEMFPLSEFKRSIRTVIQPLMDAKRIHFAFDMGCGAEGIYVDKLRFTQIFFNLLTNAAKYTPEGGSVRFSAVRIPDDAYGRHGMRFFVKDSGRGMSEEFQKIAFEPFTQEREETGEEGGCSGLGLAIVEKLVKCMGGRVSLESRPGEGTCVTVDLYAFAQPMGAEAAEPARLPEDFLRGTRVLLVEDNRLNTIVAKRLLTKKGCSVDCAENGLQGVEMFEASAPGEYQLILMDIRMPVMDGFEATRRIRALARPDARRVPIAAITADAFVADLNKTLDAGMNAHIPKPIEPRLFLDTVYRLCGQALEQNKR